MVVSGAAPFGNEQLDGLAQQVLTRIAKHALYLLVDQRNTSRAIDRQQRIGSVFDDIAERMLADRLRACLHTRRTLSPRRCGCVRRLMRWSRYRGIVRHSHAFAVAVSARL